MSTQINQIKLGVLGAGQLGRMLQLKASEWGIQLHFMDKDKHFPAGLVSREFTEGDFKNHEDVLAFAKSKDVVTIEIENVNAEALAYLETQGVKVIPSSRNIAMIKDKGLQKQFYDTNGLPTSNFKLYTDIKSISEDLTSGKLNFPFVQKSREAGYDGKGVELIRQAADMDRLMDTPSVVEDLVDIQKEVAVIIARNPSGEIKMYDTVEMVFDSRANLLDYLLCPAEINEEQNKEIIQIARTLVDKMNFEGLLAIEFFINKDGNVLINEMAPRTHNSGHHTIDACSCSQFEMQLRAILDLPLGSTELKYRYAGIVNLVGGKNTETGPVRYPGLEKVLKLEGVFPHIYGKFDVKPFRKMGHVTVCADDKNTLLEKIKIVKQSIIVKS